MSWRDGSWDRLRIDGVLMPGLLSKFDVTPSRDIQLEKGPKLDGPVAKDQGYQGATIAAELEFYKSEQAEEFAALLASLTPRQLGAESMPHYIDHPLAAMANVTKVFIPTYTLPMPEAGRRMRVPLTMLEWFPAAKATKQGTGIGSGGAFGNPAVPPPDPVNNGANFP